MRVILFQNRFATLVKEGTKTQTIRKAARCKPGDVLSLRRWTGKPYRSKQEMLREAVCSGVHAVAISVFDVTVDGQSVPGQHIAVLDGFNTWQEMRDWFNNTHGLPFSGWLIRWSNAETVRPVCHVCGKTGCIEIRGPHFHAGSSFGSLKCDYSGTPPYADAAWKDDPTICQWCAGTGHPYGDESYGMCECPAIKPNTERQARYPVA